MALAAMMPLLSCAQSWESLQEEFRSPPAESRPSTFYYWMNGNVSREGITADLESMSRIGLGSVMIFDGGVFIPKGPVDYLGAEWLDRIDHAVREAGRLGMKVGLHNAPGWSSSGGPWITPEHSMQQLVWSDVTVTGPGPITMKLPQPTTKEGFYRDARVVAFPAPEGETSPYHASVREAVVEGGDVPRPIDIARLVDGDHATHVPLDRGESIVVRLDRPFQARSVTLVAAPGSGAVRLLVEVSDDGTDYQRVTEVSLSPPRGIEYPGIATFDAVSGRAYRITPTKACRLGEVWLHGGPRIDRWNAKGNFSFQMPRPAEVPPDLPADQVIDPACVRDISAHLDSSGTLTWDAPPGIWTILRFGHTSTGQRNISAPAAGHGLESDKMSRRATDFHFQHTIDAVRHRLGPQPNALAQVLIDSYEVEMQNWTADFPAEFEARTGYSAIPFLPAMTGRFVGSALESDKFLYDVRRAQADLVADVYYGRMRELCHERGLTFLVEPYGPGPFDEMQVAGRADIPTTEFWARTPWGDNRVVESVASAAHVYGRSIIAAESFTAEDRTGRWLEHPYALKPVGDLMFALGFNHAFFHRFVHQPNTHAAPGMTMGPWGIHFDRTNTWFGQARPWIDYLSRCQHLLRQGVPVADVLVLVGERTPEVAQERRPTMPPGYRYDLVNAEVLHRRVSIDDGRIVLPEGTAYRVLMIPDDVTGMTCSLLSRLRELVTAGMTIVGPPPRVPLSRRVDPGTEGFEDLVSAIWGTDASSPSGHALGAGRVYSGRPIADVLVRMGVTEDFRCSALRADAAVAWTHRRIAGDDVYFVANRRRREDRIVCEFRTAGHAPEIWRPDSGLIDRPAVFADDGRVTLPMTMDPAESVFVVFRRPGVGRPRHTLSRNGHPLLTASPFEHPSPPTDRVGSFTISTWIKPDTDIREMPPEGTTGSVPWRGKNYVLPAVDGENWHGPGHVGLGIAAGRNGVYVMERGAHESPAVLVAQTPITGWTHLAITYHEGKPSLYLNGRLVHGGLVSGKIVHATTDAPPGPGVTHYFEGDHTDLRLDDEPLAVTTVAALVKAGLPDPPPPLAAVWQDDVAAASAVVWESGTYACDREPGVTAEVPASMTVGGPWQVSFRSSAAVPSPIALDRLESLSRHANPDVRHFAGTATYSTTFPMPSTPLAKGHRIVLDLGRVEVMADIRVNGRPVGLLWKPPFRIDISSAVVPGDNTVEVDVTTLWPNRLIGDEQSPPENDYDATGAITRLPDWYRASLPKPPGSRSTFSTWRFFSPDDPLLESGLLGPVRIRHAIILPLAP